MNLLGRKFYLLNRNINIGVQNEKKKSAHISWKSPNQQLHKIIHIKKFYTFYSLAFKGRIQRENLRFWLQKTRFGALTRPTTT